MDILDSIFSYFLYVQFQQKSRLTVAGVTYSKAVQAITSMLNNIIEKQSYDFMA